MSGSKTISKATVILKTGMVEMVEPITELVLESPRGGSDLLVSAVMARS